MPHQHSTFFIDWRFDLRDRFLFFAMGELFLIDFNCLSEPSCFNVFLNVFKEIFYPQGMQDPTSASLYLLMWFLFGLGLLWGIFGRSSCSSLGFTPFYPLNYQIETSAAWGSTRACGCGYEDLRWWSRGHWLFLPVIWLARLEPFSPWTRCSHFGRLSRAVSKWVARYMQELQDSRPRVIVSLDHVRAP